MAKHVCQAIGATLRSKKLFIRGSIKDRPHLAPWANSARAALEKASMTSEQRLLMAGVARRPQADCHEAAVGYRDRSRPEWPLYEVLLLAPIEY